jgi:dephospho-CoA kinase
VIVVDTPVEVAVERLVRFRGLAEDDARARIGRQATREQRLALADRVIDNGGDTAALAGQVEQTWVWLHGLPPADAASLSA